MNKRIISLAIFIIAGTINTSSAALKNTPLIPSAALAAASLYYLIKADTANNKTLNSQRNGEAPPTKEQEEKDNALYTNATLSAIGAIIALNMAESVRDLPPHRSRPLSAAIITAILTIAGIKHINDKNFSNWTPGNSGFFLFLPHMWIIDRPIRTLVASIFGIPLTTAFLANAVFNNKQKS